MMEANWLVYDSNGYIIRFGTVPKQEMLPSVGNVSGTKIWLGSIININPSRQKIVDGAIVDREEHEIVSEDLPVPPVNF
tara:strand:- start:75 stop:311 length:237 start_codon:yes stop_codon:yes gene_type:complete